MPLKMFKESTRSFSNECLGTTRPVIPIDSSDFALDIHMPGVTPKQSDTYFCMSVRLPVDEETFVSFVMKEPVQIKPIFSMPGQEMLPLPASPKVLDSESEERLEVNTLYYKYTMGILVLSEAWLLHSFIPGKWVLLDIGCEFKHAHPTLVHIHTMGVPGSPPPQEHGTSSDEMCNLYIMYYMEAKHAVSFMTCTQNVAPDLFRTIPPEANIPIPVKSDMVMMHGHHKETENKDKTSLLQQPKGEDVLEQGDFYSLLSKLLGEREDVVHVHKYNPTEKTESESESDLVAEIANIHLPGALDHRCIAAGDFYSEPCSDAHSSWHERNPIQKFLLAAVLLDSENLLKAIQYLRCHDVQGSLKAHPDSSGADFHIEEALDWPGVYLLPGQVSGVALDLKNNLVIFHRGDHVWDGNSFDSMFVYQQRGLGPIEEDTILVIDPNNAAVLQSSGKNLFYLPHGLSVDKDGNYWVTDVALHQVFKLDPNSKGGPLLILGRSMQPGSDQNHFCQPTDVAVDPDTGTIYVSDGYCNSRIVQFSPTGEFITQWGEESSRSNPKPGQFSVPHSLALVPHLGQLCVADRENGRIQCFKTDTKEFVREIKHASFGRNVFAISYIPGLLFAVNGKPFFGDQEPVQGFVMNFSSGEIIDVFKPVRKHFDMPHDIAASGDGTVYVGDAHTNAVWKFTLTEKMEHRSVKKAGIEVQETKDSEAVVETKMENKPASTELQKMQEKQKLIKEPGLGVPIVLITTLLVIPMVVLLAIALYIRWKKSKAFGGNGGLNLGNFFASRKGYSRKGFDRLSTEGSDQEKDEDDGSESEEEYSAPLPAPSLSSS
ncbi:hypothetical protein GH733_009905 [Mirounga leonina]|nr:hypothetical protein GH733_009905 [Mirounga leonina]